MLRTVLAIAALFFIPQCAIAATYVVPAEAAYGICPKKGVITAEPGSTISLEKIESFGVAPIVRLANAPGAVGQVEIETCVFWISDAFTSAKGAVYGSTLYASPGGSTLIGIASAAGSDTLVGGDGVDRLEVASPTSMIFPGASVDTFVVPQPRTRKVGKRTIVTDAASTAKPGDIVIRISR